MKFGYPCLNRSVEVIEKIKNVTFHLKNYSSEKNLSAIQNNFFYLEKILEFNKKNNLGFFRISSDIIPFASHPICNIAWHVVFKKKLREIGKYIKDNNFRISMHPSQFVLINAKDPLIITKSIKDLEWHCLLLDTMELDKSAKIQIHVGGAYGDKSSAIDRFIKNYALLPDRIKFRLVIENDDKIFNFKDCWDIHSATGIPIIFDNLHHECNHMNELMFECVIKASETWSTDDGLLMLDYSSQEPNAIKGKHATSLDVNHFKKFLKQIIELKTDIIFEIKDKEVSVLKAFSIYKDMLVKNKFNK